MHLKGTENIYSKYKLRTRRGSHTRLHTQIHIVVQVHSSTPILAEVHSDETAAIDRAEELKADIDPECDEIDVFSTPLK